MFIEALQIIAYSFPDMYNSDGNIKLENIMGNNVKLSIYNKYLNNFILK